jgi:hypothetical protein
VEHFQGFVFGIITTLVHYFGSAFSLFFGLVLGDGMDGLSKVLYVTGGDTGHGDSSVAGHVDGELTGEAVNLLWGQSREAEHTNLLVDVRPVAGGSELLQIVGKHGAHGDNAISHELYLAAPLSTKLSISKDGGDNTGSVDGRVGIHWANDDLQLRLNILLLDGGASDEVNGTNTLTIETEVLCKGLANDWLVTIGDELTDGEDISVGVTAGEALVSSIEKDKVSLILANLGSLNPLGIRGVNTGRVVSASMEDKDRSIRGVLH